MRSVFNDAYAILFSVFFYRSICYGYSFELPQLVKAIQMSTHNICFYKEVDKSTLVVIFKITKLLDCVLIGACAVIRSNTLYSILFTNSNPKTFDIQLLRIQALDAQSISTLSLAIALINIAFLFDITCSVPQQSILLCTLLHDSCRYCFTMLMYIHQSHQGFVSIL